MTCPYGERRGRVVFCKIQQKNVNTLVFPCLTKRFEKCKIYSKAIEKQVTAKVVAEATPANSGSAIPEQLRLEWSEERSRRLVDPATIARIVINAPSVKRLRMEYDNFHDLREKISKKIESWNEKCYIIKVDVMSDSFYMEFCKGVLIASSRMGSVVAPAELEKLFEKGGFASLTIYGPFEYEDLE